MKVISVVGARPNFIKIAPIYQAFLQYSDRVQHLICHTGQHFDAKMSKVFFDELKLPKPDFHLGVGGGSHAVQTARIMTSFEEIMLAEKPDLIIVPGDVNSTLACSLVASKMNIKIAHVEAGLRSFDRSMPEEINRVVTDVLSDYLFVTEESGLINLKKEGIADSKVFFTGNVMIDSLVRFMPLIDESNILGELGLDASDYILVTFHRPSNVDSPEYLNSLMQMLAELSGRKKVVFPVHPRTRQNLENAGLMESLPSDLILTEPIGYIDFLSLVKSSALIITDSGGIQEESTFLGVQCITVRDNTERPSTVDLGTNTLVRRDLANVRELALRRLNGELKGGSIPPLWDGKAAERIVEALLKTED